MYHHFLLKYFILFMVSLFLISCVSETDSVYKQEVEMKYDKYKAKKEVSIIVDNLLKNAVVDIDSIFYPSAISMRFTSDVEPNKYGFAYIPKNNILSVLYNIFKDYKVTNIFYYDEFGTITKEKLKKMFISFNNFQIIVSLTKGTDEGFIVFVNNNDKWLLGSFYYSNYSLIKEVCNRTSTNKS